MNKHLPLLVVIVLAAGCQKSAPPPTAQQAAPPPAAATQPDTPTPAVEAAKPVPATLPDVVARVNGSAISRAEFDQVLKGVEARAGQPVPAERRNEVFRDVLDQVIAYHLLEQESAARKLPVTDAEVEAQLKQVRQQFPDEAAFTKALGEQQMTLDKLRSETRRQLLVSKLLDAEITPTLSVQPQDIDEFYKKNPDQFQQPETVRASHILIRLPESPDAAARKQARATADDLLKQLRAGADFAKLAREKSQDPGSATNGGELPAFARGQMVPAFEEAAFALKAGQMSGVIETQFGYHIIKLLERRPAAVVPLAQVQDQIRGFLTEQQRDQKVRAFVDTLKAKGKVEILI